MKIIGLGHKMGQGKGEVARVLRDHHGALIMRFADLLKRTAMQLATLARDDVYTQEGKATHSAFLGMTHGAFLQTLGTLMREHVREDFWVQALAQRLDFGRDNFGRDIVFDLVVVEDVRYPNEAQWIRDMGGVLVKVDRPGYVPEGRDPNHPSETSLDGWEWDCVIVNDSDVEALERKTLDMLGVAQGLFKGGDRLG